MIYTAITNGKDKEREDVPVFSEFDKFTDPVLNAKIYKIVPHLFFGWEASVWVDGNVFPLKEEAEFYDLLGSDHDIGVFEHPLRDCLYKEATVCHHWRLDKASHIYRQMMDYMGNGFPKKMGLGACWLIVRRHTPEINALCERWWAHICAYSRRDQLSFPYIFRDKVKYFPKEIQREYMERVQHGKSRPQRTIL